MSDEVDEQPRRSRRRRVAGKLRYIASGHDTGGAQERAPLVLSADQQVVFDAVSSWAKSPNGTISFAGYAGTGKTSVLGMLGQHFRQERKLRVAYCSFTGKAATVLRRKLKDQGIVPDYCGTIHRLIYTPAAEDGDGELAWTLREALPFDLVVIDEASMVGRDLYDDLRSFGIPILAVGDHGQLPPVGSEAFSLVENPDYRLERIHRQAADNPIIAFSQHIRETGQIRGFRVDDPRIRWSQNIRADARAVMDVDDCFDRCCISYTNASRIDTNTAVRKARGFSGSVKVGDLVICLKNAYFDNGMLANGSRGIVTKMEVEDEPRVRVEVLMLDDNCIFSGHVNVAQFGRKELFTLDTLRETYPDTKFNKVEDGGLLFDYGYALTGHKSQGSQYGVVVVDSYVPGMIDPDTKRRWLYTATTRASEQLVINRT